MNREDQESSNSDSIYGDPVSAGEPVSSDKPASAPDSVNENSNAAVKAIDESSVRPKKTTTDRLVLFLLRIAAVAVDLLILLLLAALFLVPFLSLIVLTDVGFLCNYVPLLSQITAAPMVSALIWLTAMVLFSGYYPCRFESSEWQGTFGKCIFGLQCSNQNGRRIDFLSVAWRLILQFTILEILFSMVFASLSSFDINAVISKDQRIFILLCVLIMPYALELFTTNGQSLMDLCTTRVINTKEAKPLFSSLLKDFFPVLIFGRKRQFSKPERIASIALICIWGACAGILASALIALPQSLSQADAVTQVNPAAQSIPTAQSHPAIQSNPTTQANPTAQSTPRSALDRYRQSALFTHLDLIYYLMAELVPSDKAVREDRLSKAITLNPTCRQYWCARATCRMSENKYADALVDVSKAIELADPSAKSADSCSAIINIARWNFDERAERTSRHELRAYLFEKSGNKTMALADYTTAIQLSGRHEDYRNWKRLYEAVGEQEAAKTKEPQQNAAEQKQLMRQMQTIISRYKNLPVNQKKLEAMQLNNEGVAALYRKDANVAIEKLQKAIARDQHFDLALRNLVIAYNLKASQTEVPQQALNFSHYALYLDRTDQTAKHSVENLMTKLGMRADSFADHIKLANQAMAKNDLRGAAVESRLALEINPSDAETKRSLASIESKISEPVRPLKAR